MPSVGAKRREQELRRKLAAQTAENEIYPIPPVYDVRRRITCQRDPVEWLRTYLPDVFFVPFSESQIKFIRTCWQTIQSNGSKNIEAYRGFGKTSTLSALMLMGLCTGRFRHALYLVAEGGRMTKQAANWFSKALYEEYDKPANEARAIVADYPEICYPLQRRRGVANKPLTYKGEPCEIVISPERLQFPTIAGSPSSGSLLTFASINSPVRGASHQIRGCGSFRVGAVMFDDVQTDQTAASQKETENIVQTIKSSIGFLSGKTETGGKEPLVILSAITQNKPGDVAERIRNEMPELNTTTIPFLRSVPADFTAWRAYREKRAEIYRDNSEDAAKARELVNVYYRTNAGKLEKDCVADDPRIFEPGQLSAIQYALEKWCTSERGFWCELQNDAARGAQEIDGGLAPITVLRKGRPREDGARLYRRYETPAWCEVMTAHVDVGEHYLNYEVVGFDAAGARSHVIDFGIWPEQSYPRTSKHNFRRDLQEVYTRGDKWDRLHDAIGDCLVEIMRRAYIGENGEPVDVNAPTNWQQNARGSNGRRQTFKYFALIGVDAGDGETAPAVWQAIADFHRINDGEYFGRAIPCYGAAAKTRLMRFYDLKPGEWRRGGARGASNCDWIENPQSRRAELHKYSATIPAAFMFDANTYKTRRDEAWRAPIERDGATTIFDGEDAEYITMFAEHQCAEEIVAERNLSGQTYKTWDMKKPYFSDNEFLDTDTGARALAHYVGVEPTIGRATTPKKIKWV